MIYTNELNKEVLERHNINKADELVILGGFVGPKPVEELAEISPSISCKIIHGCFKDQAPDEITHKKYQEITNNTKVKVFYKNNYNHSKIYMWSKNKNPVDILIGSANFSSRGLYNDGQETLSDIPFTDYNSIDTIIKKALSDSQICSSYIIKPKIKIPSMVSPSPVLKLDEIVSFDPPHVRIFLGYKAGLIPEKSGLNWGFSSGHVAPDTSYLPLRSDLMQLIPGFYPFNGKNLRAGHGQGNRNKKQIAEAIWDDGTVMQLSFEGIRQTSDGSFFKQLTSFPKNNIMGRYIRKRLGLGPFKKIGYSDLIKYGRTTIDMVKIEEGIYFFDFSLK